MRTKFVLMALALAMGACGAAAQGGVSYLVCYAAAGGPTISVAIEAAPRPAASVRHFVMPRAVPMGYSQQPYDNFVRNVRAWSREGKQLEVARGEGPRWRIGTESETLGRVEYEVDLRAMEAGLRAGGDSSRVREGYAYLLGYSLLGYLDGDEDRATRVTFTGPADWQVCTTLAPAAPCAKGSVTARAANFYALADSQVVMGPRATFARVRSNAGAPLYVAVYAEFDVDRERIAAVAREAYERMVAYFATEPFPHYTAVFEFLTPVSPEHTYGFSMEHLESATFCLGPDRALKAQSTEREANAFRVNVAHHMAHAWVPKRAYGQGYFPFTWEVAPAHDSIWFSEGFGQYAAIDAIADGMPAERRVAYLESVLELRFRSTLREMPAFLLEMPLVELSHRGSYVYSEDFRVGRTLFSRGGLMAAEMDARIREKTQGGKRLRDALRHLMAWSAKNRRAFQIEELPVIFQEATGVDTRDILPKWLGPVRPGMVPAAPARP